MKRHTALIAARPLTLALGVAAALAAPARAQIPIAVGQSIPGHISSTDGVWGDGANYDLYLFYGTAGQSIQIDMISTDFDTYLILQDQNGMELARDDDGGDVYLSARITRSLGYTGMYRIVAKAYTSGRYGPYTLQLTGSGMTGVAANPLGIVGTIGFNQQVTNTLTSMDARWDNKPFQSYMLNCNAGQGFQMDILSSWDNYALVFDPMGNVVARDDDTGEGLNARLIYTCPATGAYRLAVTTYTASTQPGPYTLQVQAVGMAMPMPAPVPTPMPTPTPLPTPTPTPMPMPQPGVTLPQPVPQALPITGSIPSPGAVGTVQVGTNVQGRLETGDQQMNDGTWADVWQFQGRANQVVTIELRSDEFDAYLQLLDAAGNRLAEDDDSLGDYNARIVYTLPVTGTYQIVVNNFGDARSAGIYTLSVR
jgi:hypothetical protein